MDGRDVEEEAATWLHQVAYVLLAYIGIANVEGCPRLMIYTFDSELWNLSIVD